MDDQVATPLGLMALATILPICVALVLLPTIFFLLTLHKALGRCDPGVRTMPPGQVWLLLVPFFNVVWIFLVVIALSDSLGREFARRGLPVEREPGKSIGLAYAILGLLCAVPLVNFVTGIPALVCWILYWVKIAGFSGRLAEPAAAPVSA